MERRYEQNMEASCWGLGFAWTRFQGTGLCQGPEVESSELLRIDLFLMHFEYISQEDDVRALLALWKPL